MNSARTVADSTGAWPGVTEPRSVFELNSPDFHHFSRSVGDGLLALSRRESAECPRPEWPVTEKAAPALDQPDNAIAVGAKIEST